MSEAGSGWLGIGVAVALIWGVHERHRANEAQTELDTARAQIEDLKGKANEMASATDQLKEQLERFQTENWRDVVPDAQDAGEAADAAKDELQESAGQADGG